MEKYLSIDMACTLFWEPGCDPRYSVRYTRYLVRRIVEMARDMGFDVTCDRDPYTVYRSVWEEIWRRGPKRELWYRYVLLRFMYRIGAFIDSKTLDEIYWFFIRERAKHFTPMYRLDFILSRLKGLGYELVLTTGTASHDLIIEILRIHGVYKYFKLIFSTQLTGIPKNDHRFYQELVSLLDIEPYDLVHVGDSIEYDIEPAMKAGLKTIYFGWRTRCRSVDPQPCIVDLNDLIYLL